MKPIRPHPDHHDLHGITVAVDTHGPRLYVGRCHTIDDDHVHLVDVAVHEAGEGKASKRDFLEQAAKFGVWKQHDRLRVPCAEVAWIATLGEIAAKGLPQE